MVLQHHRAPVLPRQQQVDPGQETQVERGEYTAPLLSPSAPLTRAPLWVYQGARAPTKAQFQRAPIFLSSSSSSLRLHHEGCVRPGSPGGGGGAGGCRPQRDLLHQVRQPGRGRHPQQPAHPRSLLQVHGGPGTLHARGSRVQKEPARRAGHRLQQVQ